MRFVRGLGGTLLWVVASVLGLVSVLLCVTLILLPLGIPLLRLTRKTFRLATRLLLPRAVSHPVDETQKRAKQSSRHWRKEGRKTGKKWRKKGREAKKAAPELSPRRLLKKGRKQVTKKSWRDRLGGFI